MSYATKFEYVAGPKSDASGAANVKPTWDETVRAPDANVGAFMILTYNKDTKAYDLLAKGSSVDEFVSSCDDDKINIAGLKARVNGKDAFFHVLYIGLNVSIVQRGRAQLLKALPFNEMEGSSGELDVPVGEKISKEMLIDLIKTMKKTDDVEL